MARIRQKGTAPEIAVAETLRGVGLHYRLNVKALPGSPDFANQRGKWAVFVNGCFWHHHTACSRATVPATNTDFWRAKFNDNRRRDARAVRSLRDAGFRVAIVWECEVADAAALASKLSKISKARRINVA